MKQTRRLKRGGANEYPPGWALGAGAGNGSSPAPISANNPFTGINTTLFQNNNTNNRYYYPNNTNTESGISVVSLPNTRYSVSSNSNNAWGGPRANHPLNMFMYVPNNEEKRILRRMRSRRIARHGARRGFHNEASTLTEGSTYQDEVNNTNNNGYNANSNNQTGGKRRKHRKTLKKRRHH